MSIKDNHAGLEFTVRMENLTQQDAGVYWCGIEKRGSDPGFRIHITVLPVPLFPPVSFLGDFGYPPGPLSREGNSTMSLWRNWMLLTWVLLPGCMSDLNGPEALSGFLGRSLSVICKYDVGFKKHVKYWCKGSWKDCTIVVRTTGSEEEKMASRIFIKDNQTRLEFTVRLENLKEQDAGIYWCAIERTGSDYGFPVNITVLPGAYCWYSQRVGRGITQKVSLRENKEEHYFQVTMDNLNPDDSGVYYCVIDRLISLNIRHRVNVTVSPASS
ncbi:CMRF35-like molecule 7 [Zootoca vivipara]|uniref:CMRF35-like molecule 7 n=1 Tax=Zootoca vivipara TaxID=8524 RepID=UPI00293C03F3|nr:CMRF35-like molecule 7 [Zootoca vivipara]